MKLEEIRQIIESATPGPWILHLTSGWYQIRAGDNVCAATPMVQDARYVVASRMLMPRLLAVADAVEAYKAKDSFSRKCALFEAHSALENDE